MIDIASGEVEDREWRRVESGVVAPRDGPLVRYFRPVATVLASSF
jgi:hypothetical protein